MASTAIPTSADLKKEKLSFAKIAAAGIKPPKPQQNPDSNSSHNQKHDISSAPRDGAMFTPPDGVILPPQSLLRPKKLVQLASREGRELSVTSDPSPQVRPQNVNPSAFQPGQTDSEGLRMPPATDDASSSDSNKPPSMDGKSVASGTTFNALDEKESLRPDDSASVKAVEDEDLYSAPGSGLPSRIGSDDGVRAFRDQLREISSMEPARRGGPPPVFGGVPKGVLYVPPQGLGVGAIPAATRSGAITNPTLECAPDQKLLEALENPRDRVWVLKLEQDVIDFVKDAKESSLILPQCHSFYRLLAHKMADYYMLGHLIDDTSAAVRLYKTSDCRIPPPLTGITAPSTAASTPPPTAPAMKILRRGDRDAPAIANGSGIPSKSGSENGDSGDEKKKGPVTREEREARYEAARLRIMGSAKPAESPETPKEKQDSRSSSAAGKKTKKKARADDDDGFEARSAYSNYYTTSYGSDGVTTPAYAFPEATEQSITQFQAIYGQPPQAGVFSQAQGAPAGAQQWSQQPFQPIDPTQAWAQGQTGAYDMSSDFQRMSFQNQVPHPQSPNVAYGAGYGANYGQQYYPSSQNWQQQSFSTSPPAAQSSYGYGSPFSPPNTSTSDQPYQYGQLPSQAYPGRPANVNEHPLPGSYKGKNFNPQSQTFVPGQANGSPVTPHRAPSTPGSFQQSFQAQSPAQLARHSSTQSQASSFDSPHLAQQPPTLQHQSLKHPLPQGPIFPRQTNSGVTYPAQSAAQAPAHAVQAQSLLAKWGTPSSLPAKPPPSREPFDTSKIPQIQRQSFNAAAAARQSNGYPAYAIPQGHLLGGAGPYKG
ncbi:putative R3H domain, SUZ domain, R3H domain superfamily protein [Septoria linicola]|nr:putative R3H domain, SUZ domain, R3H domain superfamily protein [Septoria linicola]